MKCNYCSIALIIAGALGIYLFYQFIMYLFGRPFIKVSLGEKAPDFTLIDEDHNPISLHDFAGHRILLYFFPRSDTPGCIKEACGLRDSYKLFEEAHISCNRH